MTARRGPDAATLAVRVQPRASRDEVVGFAAGVLRVRVTAPPVEGEANRAVTALVARALAVRPSAVTVARGARGRDKVIRVEGLSPAEVAARLEGRSS